MGPLAAALPVISGILGIVSGVQSYRSSQKAAERQEEMDKMNADAIQAEAAETKRRETREARQRAGMSRATMGASNLRPTGSMSAWEQAQQSEFARQMKWLTQSAAGKAQIERMQGKTAAETTRSRGQQALFGSIGPGIKDIYSGGKSMKWWT